MGDNARLLNGVARVLKAGRSRQTPVMKLSMSYGNRIVSTDPPYYDNIGYADLSDFFYVWLRASFCKPIFPELFATIAVPKERRSSLPTPYRHGGKEAARGRSSSME